MMPPFKTIQEYLDFNEGVMLKKTSSRLLEEARTAAAWAVPSHECTGTSQVELSNIIYKLISHIERLEKCLNQTQLNK